MANARDLILQLKASGQSNAQVARGLGRDASIVSQILAGKKSGASYVPALERLNAGDTSVNVPRRQTKAGTQAKVRTPTLKDEKSRITMINTKTPNGAQIKSLLSKAEKHNALVGVVVNVKKFKGYNNPSTVKNQNIAIWSHGTSAEWINDQLAKGMTFQDLVLDHVRKKPGVELAEGVNDITINIIYG